MGYTAYVDKIVEPIQSNDNIAKIKLIKGQKSIENEQEQKFIETETDLITPELGAIKGIINGFFVSLPIWLLIFSLINWLI